MKNLLNLWNDVFARSPSYRTGGNYNGRNGNRNGRNWTPFRISPTIFHKSRYTESNGTRSIFLLMLFGFFGILAGFVILFVDPYDILYKFKINLSNRGEIFELWRKPPVELYLRVYLFNITNRDAFLSGKEKLKVQEVGPYVYREFMEHKNVSFNGNGTVTASPSHPLEWVPEMSNGTENDTLMLPNIALLSLANVMLTKAYLSQLAVNFWIRQTDSNPIVEMTAREFMFGYRTTMVTIGNRLLPKWIKFDKLGLIDRMYDFEGDVSTYYTGEGDISKAGLIDTYNRSPKLPQWAMPCGRVEGSSDGTKFQSYLKPNDTVRFFRKSLCRSILLVPKEEVTSRHGLRGFTYKFVENALDNGFANKENKCFCRKGKCLPRGLVDVTDCYYGFPIALSYPHYYKADPKLLEDVDGCNPDPDKHETFLVVQPETGLPLEVAVRMQINIAFDDLTPMARVGRFKNMVLPLLWTETRMYDLPEDLTVLFRMYINVLPVVQSVGIYLLFAGGLALLSFALVKIMRSSYDSDRRGSERFENLPTEDKEMKFIRSPMFNSKDVISDIIDEGKQVIFGKKTSRAPRNYSVYKETTRRKSSLTGLVDIVKGLSSQGRRKSKSEMYERRRSTEDGTEATLLKSSTDSETDSEKNKGDPFFGEDNRNFSEIEESLTKLLSREKKDSQVEEEGKSDVESFEFDLSMLGTIKEDAV